VYGAAQELRFRPRVRWPERPEHSATVPWAAHFDGRRHPCLSVGASQGLHAARSPCCNAWLSGGSCGAVGAWADVGGVPRDGPGDPGPGWRWLEVALGCARGFLDVVAVTDKGTRLRALLSIYFKYCEYVDSPCECVRLYSYEYDSGAVSGVILAK
jgi:hypothetical protein